MLSCMTKWKIAEICHWSINNIDGLLVYSSLSTLVIQCYEICDYDTAKQSKFAYDIASHGICK